MMKDVLLGLPGNQRLGSSLATLLAAEHGELVLRSFPDGESYVRVTTPVRDRNVVIACTLDRPDSKLLPLYFLARTCRDLGARRVGLVAPYLAYMRQDRRFQSGEGVTSEYFAELISGMVNWIVTVDPHLHRRTSLSEIYSIPSDVVHAAPAVSRWIADNVAKPLLIGPDVESSQWVEAIATACGAPWMVLTKVRRGDYDVEVSVPDVDAWRDRTPVLIDDIISTARTMKETIAHLTRAGLPPAVCVGVHAIFAGGAYDELLAAGAARIVTCNTIEHRSNKIGLDDLLAEAILRSRAGGNDPGATRDGVELPRGSAF
jgi:ribose-phosphate pyrophosphokinase